MREPGARLEELTAPESLRLLGGHHDQVIAIRASLITGFRVAGAD
jgi:hypothetical protein